MFGGQKGFRLAIILNGSRKQNDYNPDDSEKGHVELSLLEVENGD